MPKATAPQASTVSSTADVHHGQVLTAQAGQLLLFLLTMLLAGMVLSNLVEEKANKIIEILVLPGHDTLNLVIHHSLARLRRFQTDHRRHAGRRIGGVAVNQIQLPYQINYEEVDLSKDLIYKLVLMNP